MPFHRSSSRVDMFGNLLLDYQDPPNYEFRLATNQDARSSMSQELENILRSCPGDNISEMKTDLEEFRQLFDKFVTEPGPSVVWDEIDKLPQNSIIHHSDLKNCNQMASSKIKQMLDQLVVVKLNGALATGLGCSGPTSTIPVRDNLTSLDLTVQQLEHINKKFNTDVPLVLMNSFLTDEDTEKIVRKYSGFHVTIKTFNQSCFPRINKDTLMPVPKSGLLTDKSKNEWYPPGHGDFYKAFANSGLLDMFISEGKEVCFISNMDNVGATVNLDILQMCLTGGREFVMEVTEKTRADVKGGTLIQYQGKLRLLEVAQVPEDKLEDFMSVKKFNVFNTNNIWINLPAIKRVVTEDKLHMEIIVNPVTLNTGAPGYQLVTAIGAAMKCFDNSLGITVPRSRYLPVKKTSDLLLLMSNLYDPCNGHLTMSGKRMFPTTPFIKLGQDFKKISELQKRFGSMPDILELDHLSVSGDVTFGKNVVLKGTVIIIANHGERIDIPAGSCLENKIVSGNMRIMDH